MLVVSGNLSPSLGLFRCKIVDLVCHPLNFRLELHNQFLTLFFVISQLTLQLLILCLQVVVAKSQLIDLLLLTRLYLVLLFEIVQICIV